MQFGGGVGAAADDHEGRVGAQVEGQPRGARFQLFDRPARIASGIGAGEIGKGLTVIEASVRAYLNAINKVVARQPGGAGAA